MRRQVVGGMEFGWKLWVDISMYESDLLDPLLCSGKAP